MHIAWDVLYGSENSRKVNREHDDVIKWKQFPRYWPFVRRIPRLLMNIPHEGQGCGALMFSLICAWINDCVNNREADDLMRHRTHYDVTVMIMDGLDLRTVCALTRRGGGYFGVAKQWGKWTPQWLSGERINSSSRQIKGQLGSLFRLIMKEQKQSSALLAHFEGNRKGSVMPKALPYDDVVMNISWMIRELRDTFQWDFNHNIKLRWLEKVCEIFVCNI